MKRTSLQVSVALTALVVLAPLAGSAAAAGSPFHGSGELTATSSTPVKGGTLVEFSCEGTASHLGRFTGSAQGLFNHKGTAFTQGYTTFVAANGDELYLICAGTIAANGSLLADCEILGGTGRFEDATGSAVIIGQLGADGSFSCQFDGTIDY